MKNKFLKYLLLVVLLLLAVILGKFIGGTVPDVSFLSWLGAGASFGFAPFTLNLAILELTMGFQFSVNIAQIILLIVGIFIYSCWIAKEK